MRVLYHGPAHNLVVGDTTVARGSEVELTAAAVQQLRRNGHRITNLDEPSDSDAPQARDLPPGATPAPQQQSATRSQAPSKKSDEQA